MEPNGLCRKLVIHEVLLLIKCSIQLDITLLFLVLVCLLTFVAAGSAINQWGLKTQLTSVLVLWLCTSVFISSSFQSRNVVSYRPVLLHSCQVLSILAITKAAISHVKLGQMCSVRITLTLTRKSRLEQACVWTPVRRSASPTPTLHWNFFSKEIG